MEQNVCLLPTHHHPGVTNGRDGRECFHKAGAQRAARRGEEQGGRRETFDGDRDGGGEESSVTRETGPGRGGQEGHRASPLRTSLHSLQHLPNGFDRFGLSEDATGSGGLRSLYEAAPMGPELDSL